MKKIISMVITLIMLTCISTTSFAKTVDKNDIYQNKDIEKFTYVFNGDTYVIEKNNKEGYLDLYVNGKYKDRTDIAEYAKQLEQYQKQTYEKYNSDVTINNVVTPPPPDGEVFNISTGYEESCMWKVSTATSNHYVQVITWAYDDTYGLGWKYAHYTGSNITYLEKFKSAFSSWNSAKTNLENSGIASGMIFLISMYTGPQTAEEITKFLAVFGISVAGTSIVRNALTMVKGASDMKNAYNSITPYSSGEIQVY